MMQIKEIMRNRCSNNRGFTLIEVIAVLVILSIISIVVISRGGSSDEATLKSAAEALKGHIRFAQMKALNSDSPCCDASVSMNISSESYSMSVITGTNCTPTGTKDCASTNVVLPGAESSSGVTLPAGMTVTPTAFSFDRWGRPCSDLSGITLAPDDIDLTLTYAGQMEVIKITKNTGFVS